MKPIFYLFICINFVFSSCQPLSDAAHQLVAKTETKLSYVSHQLKDQAQKLGARSTRMFKSSAKYALNILFPVFDAYQPDTKYNKQRFRGFLQVDLTPDVHNIYAYGDFFLGPDYKVLIAFQCDSTTIQRIVATKKMERSWLNDDYGLRFGEEFAWWDQRAIENIYPYKTVAKNGDQFYLWYDPAVKTAYYEQYSL